MSFQLKKTLKGKELLILEGNTFHNNKSRNGRSYWKCSLYKSIGCAAYAITKGQELLSYTSHNHSLMHDPNPQDGIVKNPFSQFSNREDNVDKVRDAIKQKCALLTSKSADDKSQNGFEKENKIQITWPRPVQHQIDSSKSIDFPSSSDYFTSKSDDSQSQSRDSTSIFDDLPSSDSQSIYSDSQSVYSDLQSISIDSQSISIDSQSKSRDSRDSDTQSKFSDSQPQSVSSQSSFSDSQLKSSDSSSRSDNSQSSNVDTKSSSAVDGSECDTPDCIEYRPFGCSDDEEKLFSKYSPFENKKRKIESEDDPNLLVDRLRVVISKIQNGDLSYTAEMSSIIGALKKGGYIY